ncbi:uncharacterized protein LOC128959529 [Oppia nitens]|uniref:uncharacterized protein LOC128959529 n=1 Tax=Oppia nitens TaxID=1686743 RepID=UPI0023D9CA75|nr:uncharacterized protein LOC128959529 [Oppia nitens]
MKFVLVFLTLIVGVFTNEWRLHNNCPFTVWPGILGNPGKGNPEGGGFALDQGQTHTYQTANDWAGRVWGRTNCNGDGHCETGDCGNKIQCQGAGGVPPATLAEFTLNGNGGQDFYDVSLVDGYNLPLRISPIDGTYSKTDGGKYDCNVAGCTSDLNAQCPGELAVKNSGGATIACMSACTKFNTDEYCCRGSHNTAPTCKSSDWPTNYPSMFKGACPDAYSYAYDDTNSLSHCKGNPQTGYEITFCP